MSWPRKFQVKSTLPLSTIFLKLSPLSQKPGPDKLSPLSQNLACTRMTQQPTQLFTPSFPDWQNALKHHFKNFTVYHFHDKMTHFLSLLICRDAIMTWLLFFHDDQNYWIQLGAQVKAVRLRYFLSDCEMENESRAYCLKKRELAYNGPLLEPSRGH